MLLLAKTDKLFTIIPPVTRIVSSLVNRLFAFSDNAFEFVQDPTFTPIPGVTALHMPGGCYVGLINYQVPESMGTYQVGLSYIDATGKPQGIKERKKMSVTCKQGVFILITGVKNN